MKKIILLASLVMGLGVTNISAQGLKKFLDEKFSGGLKLEGNGTNFLLSDMPGTKSEIGFGGTFGGFIKIDLSKNFAIQEDILFSYSSSKLKQNNIEDTYEYLGLEIPIFFMGQ